MFKYTKIELEKIAKDYNFNRDTLEKVYRLIDVLIYLNSNPLTKEILALKGGTAINLLVFNLPRLSIDIDLDYSKIVNREEMLEDRLDITMDIKKYMLTNEYNLSNKSRYYHSLDSFIFTYKNFGGTIDNIKIEINYSLRNHIYKLQRLKIMNSIFDNNFTILTLHPYELFATKINALISRATARDLYDVFNYLKYGIFDKSEYETIKKVVIFYTVVTQDDISLDYNINKIDSITMYKIKTGLLPVIKKGEFIEIIEIKKIIKHFLSELLDLNEEDKLFLRNFNNKNFTPDLLFKESEILERISNHPMILWKIVKNQS